MREAQLVTAGMDPPGKCLTCGKLAMAWHQVCVKNLPRGWNVAQVLAWVAKYTAGWRSVKPVVKVHPAVRQAVLTFSSHLIACQFVQALTVEPFCLAFKDVVYVFEVSWYIMVPMFAGSLPVVPVVVPTRSALEQRVVDMQLTLDTLVERVASLEEELEVWRSGRRVGDDVAAVNAPLSPRSQYTQDEVECFLRECLP